MLKTVEGIYRHGQIKLLEPVPDTAESRVIVTFLDNGVIDLATRGISPEQASDLRLRLKTFAEDWQKPEMDVYDAPKSR